MRIFQALLALFVVALPSMAQTPQPIIPLWPNGVPGAVGETPEDQPHLEVFLPDAATLKLRQPRTGVIILPGGSYHTLAMQKEGQDPARWFTHLGIPAFVLTYRLGPRYHYPAAFDDATRAVRYVRTQAAEYGIDPDRIGMMGFSAGGHLASNVATHSLPANPGASDPFERVSSRPDFLILGYPVIDPLGPAAIGSYHYLLGDTLDLKMLTALSTDKNVTPQTPPTFLVAASDDAAVFPQSSLNFYQVLVQNNVPAEMHLYEHGGHGFGMATLDPDLSGWMDTLLHWLDQRGLLTGPGH